DVALGRLGGSAHTWIIANTRCWCDFASIPPRGRAAPPIGGPRIPHTGAVSQVSRNGDAPASGSYRTAERQQNMKLTDYAGGYARAQVEQLRTGAFTAEIHRDGKHVIEVENDGRGGSNRYYAVLEESNAEVHALREYAARDFGDFEPADAFVEVLIDIDIIRNYIRRSGARFSEVAEAIIVDSEEAAIPETVSY